MAPREQAGGRHLSTAEPSGSDRWWTVDEARRYLPRLRHLLAVLRRAGAAAVAARANGHASVGEGSPPVDDEGELVGAPVDAAGALAELEANGIVLRDLHRGLVDFPGRVGERTVYLCWRQGEVDIGWWHYPEEGFAGRKRLPLPPEPG